MLSKKILETMKRFGMISPGERVVIGLSGGRDSVALTTLLLELSHELGLSLVLAHLNHGLRPDAIEDEAFCEAFAHRLSLPFVAERVDVASDARVAGRSIEDEGRRARYRFLDATRERCEADRVAVGHTLDDQAETFLLRLFRGSGGRGLASAYPIVGGRRIRPLLETRRRDLARYLNELGIAFRDDPSNDDPRFTRNRVRREAMPRLVEEYNPRLVEALARTASLLRDEESWMELLTAEAFSELLMAEDGTLRVDAEGLGRAHPALRRRLVRLALERARGSLKSVSHRHVEDVLALLSPGKSGREVHLPGLVVERSFGELRFRRPRLDGPKRGRITREHGYNGFEYRLMIPARIRIPGGTLRARFSNRLTESGRRAPSAPTGNRVTVGIEGNVPQLGVRSPRPGDRFHPLGAPGSKSLARYLMDRKVPREARGSVPLVVDMEGNGGSEQILWVVGHGVSERSRLSGSRRRLAFEWVAE